MNPPGAHALPLPGDGAGGGSLPGAVDAGAGFLDHPGRQDGLPPRARLDKILAGVPGPGQDAPGPAPARAGRGLLAGSSARCSTEQGLQIEFSFRDPTDQQADESEDHRGQQRQPAAEAQNDSQN